MRTFLTCLLTSVLFLAAITIPVSAQGVPLEKVKAKVAKIGVGEKAKATVHLKDGTKKKGYIGQAGTDEFVLRDRKSDEPTTFRYSEVSKVDSNKGHSTAWNLAVGMAIGAGALLGILMLVFTNLE